MPTGPKLSTLRCLSVALVACGLVAAPAGAQGVAEPQTLEYLARYDHQPGPDHLIDVLAIDSTRALVASNERIALIDLSALTAGGTQATLSTVEDVHVRNLYQKDDSTFFANLFGGECEDGLCGPGGSPGFAILRLSGDDLQLVRTVDEASFFEKMAIVGDLLYVTAHRLRVVTGA